MTTSNKTTSKRILGLLLAIVMMAGMCMPAGATGEVSLDALENVHIVDAETVTEEPSVEEPAVAQAPAAPESAALESVMPESAALESTLLESGSIEVNGTVYSFSGGFGTEADPYLISTDADLAALRDASIAHYNLGAADKNFFGDGLYFKQTADLSLSGAGIMYFCGVYDGGGHSVALTINAKTSNAMAFIEIFGADGCTSVLKNLTVTGSVDGSALTSAWTNAAGVAASADTNSTIYNVGSSATVTAGSFPSRVGGLVGTNAASIVNCWCTGAVSSTKTSDAKVGGLVGWNAATGVLFNCWYGGASKPTYPAASSNFGGWLVGNNKPTSEKAGTVAYCYAPGSSLTDNIGNVGTAANVTNVETKTVSKMKIAGFVTTLNNNRNKATYVSTYAPGLAQSELWCWAATKTLPLQTKEMITFEGAGIKVNPFRVSTDAQLAFMRDLSLIAGDAEIFSDVYFLQTADLSLSGSGFYCFSGQYSGNGHTVTLDITESTNGYAGMFGYLRGTAPKVESLVLKGSVNVSGVGKAAALAGCADGTAQIYNVASTVNVTNTGGEQTGGLVGDLNGTMVNCASSGAVAGGTYAGGLAGQLGTAAKVFNCWYGGPMPTAETAGSIAGTCDGASTVAYTYSLSTAGFGTGTPAATGVETKTDAEMKTAAFSEQLNSNRNNASYVSTYAGGIAQEELFCWGTPDNSQPVFKQLSFNGFGTEADPYLISTDADLAALRDASIAHYNLGAADKYFFGDGLYFKQTADLSLSGAGITLFCGVYDGGGHSVALTINAKTSNCMAFIEMLGADGCTSVLKNLTVTGSVDGSAFASAWMHAGGVAAVANDNSTIYNVGSSATVTAGSFPSRVGGLVGTNVASIVNCWCTGAVSGTKTSDLVIGGLVGWNAASGVLFNCWYGGASKPTYPAASSNFGGWLVGNNKPTSEKAGTVAYCYAPGNSLTDNIGNVGTAANVTNVETKTVAEMQENAFAALLNDNKNNSSYVNSYAPGLTASDLKGWQVNSNALPTLEDMAVPIPPVTTGVTISGKLSFTGKVGGLKATVALLDGNGETVYSESVAYTEGGNTYTLSNVAAGTYTLQITKLGHLTYTDEAFKVGEEAIELNDFKLFAGKVTTGNRILFSDLQQTVGYYNSSDALYDFDESGKVQMNDLMICCIDYNKEYTTLTPKQP